MSNVAAVPPPVHAGPAGDCDDVHFFAQASIEVMADAQLNPVARLIAFAFTDACRDGRICTKTNKTIAGLIGVPPLAVARFVGSVVERGILERADGTKARSRRRRLRLAIVLATGDGPEIPVQGRLPLAADADADAPNPYPPVHRWAKASKVILGDKGLSPIEKLVIFAVTYLLGSNETGRVKNADIAALVGIQAASVARIIRRVADAGHLELSYTASDGRPLGGRDLATSFRVKLRLIAPPNPGTGVQESTGEIAHPAGSAAAGGLRSGRGRPRSERNRDCAPGAVDPAQSAHHFRPSLDPLRPDVLDPPAGAPEPEPAALSSERRLDADVQEGGVVSAPHPMAQVTAEGRPRPFPVLKATPCPVAVAANDLRRQMAEAIALGVREAAATPAPRKAHGLAEAIKALDGGNPATVEPAVVQLVAEFGGEFEWAMRRTCQAAVDKLIPMAGLHGLIEEAGRRGLRSSPSAAFYSGAARRFPQVFPLGAARRKSAPTARTEPQP